KFALQVTQVLSGRVVREFGQQLATARQLPLNFQPLLLSFIHKPKTAKADERFILGFRVQRSVRRELGRSSLRLRNVMVGASLRGTAMVRNPLNKRFPRISKTYDYVQFPSLLPQQDTNHGLCR